MRTTYYTKDSRHAVLDRVHRYRAIKAGVAWEKIDLQEVFHANKNCAVCGTEMTFSTGQQDPQYVSLDHIKPLSKGGTHTRNNVQLTHISCNKSKGKKGNVRES